MKETVDPLGSRSYSSPSRSVEFLASKLFASWCSLTYVYLRSSHSLVPSNLDDSLKPAWLRGDSDLPQYVRHNKSRDLLLKVMFKSVVYQKHSSFGSHRSVQMKISPQSIARHPPGNGQARRRLVQLPGSNTKVCLDFVSKTFICRKLLYVVYWIDVVVLKLISSVRQKFQRDGWGRIVLVAVDVVPVGNRPSAADDSIHPSTGGKCGFGFSAPLLTKASPMHFSGARGGTAILTMLVKLIGPSSTLFIKELSPCFARSATASSVRLQVLMSGFASSSMVRRGCQASCSRPAKS